MIRLGSQTSEMREMDPDDFFLCRLKLLIIMTMAFLNGYPLGRHRRSAITRNAEYLLADSRFLSDPTLYPGSLQGDGEAENRAVDAEFHESVLRFAELSKLFSTQGELGPGDRSALEEILSRFTEAITIEEGIVDIRTIRVA